MDLKTNQFAIHLSFGNLTFLFLLLQNLDMQLFSVLLLIYNAFISDLKELDLTGNLLSEWKVYFSKH